MTDVPANDDTLGGGFFAAGDLLGRLPPPNDNEPPSLRSDILDELADHLTCAAAREAAAGHGSRDCRSRVLARFGNPAAVALQLWLQNQKGRLLMQRFTLGAALVSTVLSLIAVGAIAAVLIQQTALIAAVSETTATLNDLSAGLADQRPPASLTALEPPSPVDESTPPTETADPRQRVTFTVTAPDGSQPNFSVSLVRTDSALQSYSSPSTRPGAETHLGAGEIVLNDIGPGHYQYAIETDDGWQTLGDGTSTFYKSAFEPFAVEVMLPDDELSARGELTVETADLDQNRYEMPSSKDYKAGHRIAWIVRLQAGGVLSDSGHQWARMKDGQWSDDFFKQLAAKTPFASRPSGSAGATSDLLVLSSAYPTPMRLTGASLRSEPSATSIGFGGESWRIESQAEQTLELTPASEPLSVLAASYQFDDRLPFLVPEGEDGLDNDLSKWEWVDPNRVVAGYSNLENLRGSTLVALRLESEIKMVPGAAARAGSFLVGGHHATVLPGGSVTMRFKSVPTLTVFERAGDGQATDETGSLIPNADPNADQPSDSEPDEQAAVVAESEAD